MVVRFSPDLNLHTPVTGRESGRFPVGAPGVYLQPELHTPALTPSRMDVCAFVGVAPRGPARLPVLDDTWTFDRPCVESDRPRRRSVAVAVESFAEYRRLFSGFEGPGRLPYAVAAFFEQGGTRAYIVRIVHDFGDTVLNNQTGVAQGIVATGAAVPLTLRAHSSTELYLDETDRGRVTANSLLRVTLSDGRSFSRQVELVDEQVPESGGDPLPHITFHNPLPDEPVSIELVPGVLFVARNEGTWGNQLRASLGYTVTPLDVDSATASLTGFRLNRQERLPIGTLVRVTMENGTRVLRFLQDVRRQVDDQSAESYWQTTFDSPLIDPLDQVEAVYGRLTMEDGSGYQETHQQLGLSSAHPRWLATVLCNESELVFPHESWTDREILPDLTSRRSLDPLLDESLLGQFADGDDRYAQIVPDDFFDDSWVAGDPDPGAGLHAVIGLEDVSSVVLPDLYSHEPLAPADSILDEPPRVGGEFEPCIEIEPAQTEQETAVNLLEGLSLDPRIPSDLKLIIGYQKQAVDLADLLREFVVLLDVPPGLTERRILNWRGTFRSSYAAAYHPWIKVSRPDDNRDRLIRINPSAFAAGIIARQEHLFGVPHGPANVIAAGAVDLEQAVAPGQHDRFHPLGINVYLRERDGVRLTAGRTLSRDSQYRQLTVRRLMIMLRRVLRQQMAWSVFEPNGPSLWADVRYQLRTYLRQLYRAGAFRGATEEEAFFVRCDEMLNTPYVRDAGQMIAEIGIAPTEPLEFIVVQIVRQSDGTLAVET